MKESMAMNILGSKCLDLDFSNLGICILLGIQTLIALKPSSLLMETYWTHPCHLITLMGQQFQYCLREYEPLILTRSTLVSIHLFEDNQVLGLHLELISLGMMPPLLSSPFQHMETFVKSKQCLNLSAVIGFVNMFAAFSKM